MDVYLPIGDLNANYILILSVDVRDIYGAVNSTNFTTVTVN